VNQKEKEFKSYCNFKKILGCDNNCGACESEYLMNKKHIEEVERISEVLK